MERTYFFLFKLPPYKDWAFYLWLALAAAGSDGGSNFVSSAIAFYVVSFIWLVPRRMIFRGSSKQILDPTIFNKFESKTIVETTYEIPVLDQNTSVILRSGNHQDVVGESNYLQSFKTLAGKEKSGEIETLLQLEREPSNPYDKNAIAVKYNGLLLGFIPREENGEWQDLLKANEDLGKKSFAHGRIWWDLSQVQFDAPFGSVSLDIAEPKFAKLINDFPSSKIIDITGERAYQLSGEGENLSTIEKLLDQGVYEKGVAAIATLKNQILDHNSEKTQVNIFVDGELIGSLSGVTGAKFAPILARVTDEVDFVAEVEITGNALAAEAKIFLTLPEDLSKDKVELIKLNSKN